MGSPRHEQARRYISAASPRKYRCIAYSLLLLTFIAFVENYEPAITLRWMLPLSKNRSQDCPRHQSLLIPILSQDSHPFTSTLNNDSCKGPLGLMPRLKQYSTPASYPSPALGSYRLTNIDSSRCMTYIDRYEPYTDKTLRITYLDKYHTWLSSQPRSFGLDSAAASQLSSANEDAIDSILPQWKDLVIACQRKRPAADKKKTAVLLRVHQNYTWHMDDILNVRALITELSLNNVNPFDVRILLEVHQKCLPIYSSSKHRRQVLSHSIPREFWGLVELWNEGNLEVLYPNLPGKFLNRMSAQNSCRSSFMPVQMFALEHTEHEYIWNWEMESRFTGDYLELFEASRVYAKQEALHPDASKYKTWLIQNDTASEAIWTASNYSVGVGKEADLIVFNPIFDPRESGWYWAYDIQNYRAGANVDRRASIGRNVRFSRSLLDAMNTLNAQEGKSAHCETWPATVVLHSNQAVWHNGQEYDRETTSSLASSLKAVYVPHPVYIAPGQSPAQLSSALKKQDFYRKVNEKAMRGASFYDQANMGSDLYKDWKAKDRSCIAPALLSPVRWVK